MFYRPHPTHQELLREAEWWSRMADLESLSDADLLARARQLVPALTRRLDLLGDLHVDLLTGFSGSVSELADES